MKQLKTIITFPNTHSALAAEKFVERHEIKARLIPVPVEISAECGLALCMSPDIYNQFIKTSDEFNLIYSSVYNIEI